MNESAWHALHVPEGVEVLPTRHEPDGPTHNTAAPRQTLPPFHRFFLGTPVYISHTSHTPRSWEKDGSLSREAELESERKDNLYA